MVDVPCQRGLHSVRKICAATSVPKCGKLISLECDYSHKVTVPCSVDTFACLICESLSKINQQHEDELKAKEEELASVVRFAVETADCHSEIPNVIEGTAEPSRADSHIPGESMIFEPAEALQVSECVIKRYSRETILSLQCAGFHAVPEIVFSLYGPHLTAIKRRCSNPLTDLTPGPSFYPVPQSNSQFLNSFQKFTPVSFARLHRQIPTDRVVEAVLSELIENEDIDDLIEEHRDLATIGIDVKGTAEFNLLFVGSQTGQTSAVSYFPISRLCRC